MKGRRIIILSALIALATALVLVSIFAFAYAGSNNTNSINSDSTAPGTNGYYPDGCGMMGGYGGSPSTAQTPITPQSSIWPFLGIAALVGAALTGAGGAVYYFAVPKIRRTAPIARSTVRNSPQNALSAHSVITPYASVYKTLKTEERKVLDIIVSHDGKYLQKYIRSEAGLSRLKTHRIVTRLAERGIVTLEKSGNTNEVHLSKWIQPKPSANPMNNRSKEPVEIEARP